MTLPITAIVPVRNAASHLRQALDPVSVAGVAETIVIDGGSTDSGPFSLGAGQSKYSRAVTKSEWRQLMLARRPY